MRQRRLWRVGEGEILQRFELVIGGGGWTAARAIKSERKAGGTTEALLNDPIAERGSADALARRSIGGRS